MIQKATNYDEAVEIIKKSADDAFSARYRQAFVKRGLITLCVCLAVACIAGLMTKNPVVTLAMLPAAGVITLAAFLPLIAFNHTLKKYKTGEFFARRSEEEIIAWANVYADQYNVFEKNEQLRRKK